MTNVVLRAVLSIPVGMSMWAWQGYIFGMINQRWLTYGYLALFALIGIKRYHRNLLINLRNVFHEFKHIQGILVIVIVLSSFIQVFGHVGSGLKTEAGISFYFVNAVDGIMHLGYIQSLANAFPPQEPGRAGAQLINYHYWSDLVMAEITRIWSIPPNYLFFQLLPIITSLFTTTMLVILISQFGGSRRSQYIGILLLTFGSDAAYSLTLILHRLWGEAVASLDSGVSFYFNIPQVFARMIFLSCLIIFNEWRGQPSGRKLLLLAFIIASLLGFKVYYGLFFGSALGVFSTFGILHFVRTRKLFVSYRLLAYLGFLVVLVLLSALVYLPTNYQAGGLTVSMLEWPKRLLSAENISYSDWFLRMQVYEAAGNIRNIVIYSGFAIILAFIGIYGTRMLGLFPIHLPNKRAKEFIGMFYPAMLVFIGIGLTMLQISGGLNIYNFLITPIIVMVIITSLNIDAIPRKIAILLIPIIILITLPRSIMQLRSYARDYLENKPEFILSSSEQQALTFIRDQTPQDAIIQQYPLTHHETKTPYVAYFSNRLTFLGGIEMIRSHNQPWEDRNEILELAESASSISNRREILKSHGIDYLMVQTKDVDEVKAIQEDVLYSNEFWSVVSL